MSTPKFLMVSVNAADKATIQKLRADYDLSEKQTVEALLATIIGDAHSLETFKQCAEVILQDEARQKKEAREAKAAAKAAAKKTPLALAA